MHKMLLNFAPVVLRVLERGMSDDAFCAQVCWIVFLRCMALNSVNTSLSICNPNVLEHKPMNSVVGVVEISVNLLLLPVH